MPRTFQNQLLNFMESGRVKVDQLKKQYHFEIEGAKVFATCNEINRLSKPLQSRFRKLFLPRYTVMDRKTMTRVLAKVADQSGMNLFIVSVIPKRLKSL